MNSATTPSPTPNTYALMHAWFLIGALGFGSPIAMARHQLVRKRQWLSELEFTNILGICHFVPGAPGVNMAIAVGKQFGGNAGVVVCFLSYLLAPMVIILAIGGLYSKFGHLDQVRTFLAGMAAAAAGLFLSSALGLVRPHVKNWASMTVIAISIVTALCLRLPIIACIGLLLPVSILLGVHRK